VAGAGSGLVPASPAGPFQLHGRCGRPLAQSGEQPADLVAGQRDELVAAGGPLEFEVTMMFYPAGGTPWTETIDYYLKCTQILGAIPARLLGCPVGDIRIDRLERVS
jgi:hypothetical protein